MFKIAETADTSDRFGRPIRSFPGADQAGRHQGLQQYCLSEEWSADLEEGVVRLGAWTAIYHGLSPSSSCGLTSLTRAYDSADRHRIVGLFEQAAASPSSFCFSAVLRLADGKRQPVFCMAESALSVQGSALALGGLFLFPRFKLDGRSSDFAGPFARFA